MPSAGVLLTGPRGRVLLCQRSDSGQWATPAGHLEPGEEPWQAAVRELHEETLFTGMLRNFRLRRRLGRFWLFEAEVDREFRPVLDHEHLACRWVFPGRPPVPLHPGLDGVL